MTHTLYQMVRLLEEQKLWYRVDRHRHESIMLTVTIVGERLEVDVFEDGHIEFSRFKGDESVNSDAAELDRLLHLLGAKQDTY